MNSNLLFSVLTANIISLLLLGTLHLSVETIKFLFTVDIRQKAMR